MLDYYCAYVITTLRRATTASTRTGLVGSRAFLARRASRCRLLRGRRRALTYTFTCIRAIRAARRRLCFGRTMSANPDVRWQSLDRDVSLVLSIVCVSVLIIGYCCIDRLLFCTFCVLFCLDIAVAGSHAGAVSRARLLRLLAARSGNSSFLISKAWHLRATEPLGEITSRCSN